MFTIAPETCPYSGLNVELSILNSSTLATGGGKPNRTKRQVVRRDAVDDVSHGLFAIPGRVEGERSGPAKWRRGKPGLRRRHGAWHKRSEIDEVSTIERDFMDGLWRHHVADCARCAIQKR